MSLNRIKQRLQAALKLKGYGLLSLANSFKEFDINGDGELSWEEFNRALQKCGIAPSPQDVRALFIEMDSDGSNSISYKEFVNIMRGPISPKRRDLITRVFEGIDRDNDGVVSMTDIGSCFNPKNHPDVKDGKVAVSVLLKAFMDTFATISTTGLITLPQFIEYYANISAYDDDIVFERVMNDCWNISKSSRSIASSGPKSLQAFAKGNSTETEASSIPGLDALRDQLIARGARGIVGLQRKFRIIDDDGNKSLNMAEFKKAIKECSLVLPEMQLIQLFRYFDKDNNGSLNFDEFIQGIRGNLNLRRKRLVDMAFARLDKRGTGEVAPEDLVGVYDASKHPDVIAGKRSADEVLREFLETFDIGGEVDGKVTQQEFENYYANLSASVDDDDYFELMIRNAWHISGGEGWSANSSNRRVLVTGRDGSESVREIQDDMGLRAGDRAGAISRLQRQGIDASSVSFFDGADNTSAPSKQRSGKAIVGRYSTGGGGGGGGGSGEEKIVSLSSNLARMGVGLSGSSATAGSLLPPPSSVNVALAGPKASNKPQSGRASFIPEKPAKEIPNAGVALIVKKLKDEMASRGAHGFIGLQRKFRIIDDDNTKSLSRAEFNKAMKEMNMNLSDPELRTLFDYFDADRSSYIDFEEFIQGVRDPLNDRRKTLVQMAFHALDKDGSGVVDAQEIAQTYDSSKHPEVIAGRMTPNEVFAHFLDTFDVGGVHDGMVTLPEFINYYTNIGANIDNDDYFELMIRNAWHLSGGEGWSANSSNRRVLVTRQDGSQSVEEIQDDLGLKQGDKAGVMARLQKQGVGATSIDLYGSFDNTSGGFKPRPGTAAPSGGGGGGGGGGAGSGGTSAKALSIAMQEKAQQARNVKRDGWVGSQPSPDVLVAQLGPRTGTLPPQITAPAPMARPSTAPSRTDPERPPNPGLQSIIVKLKGEMKSRGAAGFIGLQRKFRIMDDDGSKSLNLMEFKKAMKEMSMGLTDAELRMLFDYFDTDHTSTIDFEEFIQGVRDPLNERRLRLVKMAFAKLDKDGSGIVDAAEIASTFDASKHPDVIAGKATADQIFTHFLDTFDVGGVHDGKVTLPEFINYYTNLGANVDNDDYFELMIRNAWHLSGGEGWSANSSNRRVLVTHPDGSQTVEEIQDDLGLNPGDKAGMLARLQKQGVSAAALSLHDGVEDKIKDVDINFGGSTKRFSSQYGRSTVPSGVLPGTVATAVPPYLKGSKLKAPPSAKEVNYGLQQIVAKLKAEIASRGARGFVGLQRKFRIIDDDGSKSLSLAEFKKAMKEMNMNLNDAELRMLFDHFDTDHSSTIDFEEFIQGVRDPLTERRRKLVETAFRKIDKDNSGIVDAQEIGTMYDASKHPEVMSGRLSPEQVFREFLDTFDVGGVHDGKVTLPEFINYYTNIGASIDNDDYFELMIRNAWHISGGEGWSANSSNRHVLVTGRDGSESVREIQDDMGLKSDDRAGMIARLQNQGVEAANISLYGGFDNTTAGKKPKPTNIGKIAKSQSRDPSAIGVVAGKQTVGLESVKNTIQPRDRDQGSRGGGGGKKKSVERVADYGLQMIIQKLKSEITSRGSHGFIGLQRKFRIIDDDNSKTLSRSEFSKAMKEMNMGLNDAELRMLFDHFDTASSDSIDFEEFVQGVRDPLNERRKRLVDMAFTRLDVSGDGILDASELLKKYDASKHPDVIQGTKTPQQVLHEFMHTFDVGGVVDDMVTQQEFENYYTNIGANIDNDDYFELMIRNAWHISGGEGWSANSSNRRVLVTRPDGSQYVQEIQDDLGLNPGDKSGMMARLRRQGDQVSQIDLYGSAGDKEKGKPAGFSSADRQRMDGRMRSQEHQNAHKSAVQFGDDGWKPKPKSNTMRKMMSSDSGGSGTQVEDMLADLKDQLAARGARGIVGLQRKFRIIDDDNSQSLSFAEFKKAMQECALVISEEDCRRLFSFFDTDRSGEIDFEEFVNGLKGPLSMRRKSLISQAFAKLDKTGDGVIDPEEVMSSYDASRHPDVLAGKRTAQEVLREFLDTFDVGGIVDGKVTHQEFENYYSNLGATIDDDDYFELMIRNAWHLSGGKGWSANSANRRVLVTRPDGSQYVQEIQDDLGLKQGDKAGMMARLQRQGVSASSISLYDGGDDGVGADKKMTSPMRDTSLVFGREDQGSERRLRRMYPQNAATVHQGDGKRDPTLVFGRNDPGVTPRSGRKSFAHQSQLTIS